MATTSKVTGPTPVSDPTDTVRVTDVVPVPGAKLLMLKALHEEPPTLKLAQDNWTAELKFPRPVTFIV